MAIASTGSSGSSAGAIGYVLSEDKSESKKPEVLAGSFGTAADIREDFEEYNKLNRRIKNQATHISISLAPGEQLAPEKKVEFAEKLLEKLDFKNVPYLVVEHHDKEYEHFHIVAGRIREDGSTVKEWKIAERAIKATKELEKEFGLQEVEFTKSDDRRTKRGEYKLMEKTGELSVIAEAKRAIDKSLESKPTTTRFVDEMREAGFDVLPNISEATGKMNGFSFRKGEIKFKSSAIARDCSFAKLQERGLDFEQWRDKGFLIGVKNESTTKRAGETGFRESNNNIGNGVGKGAVGQFHEPQQQYAGNGRVSSEPGAIGIDVDKFGKNEKKIDAPNNENTEAGAKTFELVAQIEDFAKKLRSESEGFSKIRKIFGQGEAGNQPIEETDGNGNRSAGRQKTDGAGEQQQNISEIGNTEDNGGVDSPADRTNRSKIQNEFGGFDPNGQRVAGDYRQIKREDKLAETVESSQNVEMDGIDGGEFSSNRNIRLRRGQLDKPDTGIDGEKSGIDGGDSTVAEAKQPIDAGKPKTDGRIEFANTTVPGGSEIQPIDTSGTGQNNNQVADYSKTLTEPNSLAEQVFSKLITAMAEQNLILPEEKQADMQTNIESWASLPAQADQTEFQIYNAENPATQISCENKTHLEAYSEFVNKIEEKGDLEDYAVEVYELGISMTISPDKELDIEIDF